MMTLGNFGPGRVSDIHSFRTFSRACVCTFCFAWLFVSFFLLLPRSFFRFLLLLFVVFSYVIDIDFYGVWLTIELRNRQFMRDGISGRPAPLTSVYTWCMYN